jgi:diguanylate cyclase (GGDEF)-like protein
VRVERRAIWFLVVVAFLACIALALYGLLFSRANALRVAENARAGTDTSSDHLDRYVASGSQLAASAAAIASSLRGDIPRTERLLKTLLASTPSDVIYGMGLWYQPYAFSPRIRLFGPYVHRTKTGAIVLTYGWSRLTYDYVRHAWYRKGLQARRQTAITEPYFDVDHVYISAVHDIRHENASLGVATVDTTSEAIDKFLNRISSSDRVTYLTTLNGRVVAFPHAAQLLTFASSAHAPSIILDVTDADAQRFIAGRYPGPRIVTRVRAARIPVILVNSWTASSLGSASPPTAMLAGTAAFVWLMTFAAILAIRRARLSGLAALDTDRERTRLSLELQTRASAEQALRKAANVDALTGLANRGALIRAINESIDGARRADGRDYLVFVDVNGFERINSTFGHVAGDQALAELGALLRRCARENDLAARLGGDQFAVLVRGDGTAAHEFGNCLHREMTQPLSIGGETIFLDAGIGVAEIVGDYARAEEVIRDADFAMYQAKRSARAAIVEFDPALRETAVAQRELQAALRGAVDRGEITIAYQPIYRLAERTLVGFEALMRWQRPGQGTMQPGAFIPVAERTGVILELDRHVAEAACAHLAEWQRTAPDLRLAINASALHFEHAGALRELIAALRRCPVRPGTLDVEITESALMGLTREAIDTVRELHALDIRLHLDDFGTGYSSLTYLQHLHVDALKIDRTFVSSMLNDERSMQIVNAVVNLARGLRVEIVAEGVETESHERALIYLGVTMGQGFLYGKPMSAEEAGRLVSR